MCGIVGAVAKRPVAKLLVDGLKRLEYRGYDSAGLAVMNTDRQLKRLRVAGKVRDLEALLVTEPLVAHMGIAHTRWATHGIPSEVNAHPFVSNDKFALVHNGIIENHASLRERLKNEGYEFHSETDTETVVHLLHFHYAKSNDLMTAIRSTIGELEGAYALGIFSTDFPERVIGVRQGAPLVVGIGQNENFLASDPLALLSVTNQFVYLEDYDIVDINLNGIQIYDRQGATINRDTHTLSIEQNSVERGEYRHFMKKEIMEQPDAIASCLEGRIAKNHVLPAIFGPKAETIFPKVEHIQLVACGTSYHAALVARYWIESLVGIPCSVEVASEYRYRGIAESKNSLYVTLSQSGETADTLAALRLAKKMNYLGSLVICNVPGSTMMRESDLNILTRAGVEIGVASTKAFVTQLSALFLLTLTLMRVRNHNEALEKELTEQLQHLPALVQQVLQQDEELKAWAKSFVGKQHALFLGRGILYPIALEGALKLKEISYVHAEGYPSGELKHGPLALVDDHMPVIATLPNDHLLEKALSNLQEVRARGGRLYVLTDEAELLKKDGFAGSHIMTMPKVHPVLTPILYTVPLQLLSYHVAVLRGTDVDQPRNLAKSVTVE